MALSPEDQKLMDALNSAYDKKSSPSALKKRDDDAESALNSGQTDYDQMSDEQLMRLLNGKPLVPAEDGWNPFDFSKEPLSMSQVALNDDKSVDFALEIQEKPDKYSWSAHPEFAGLSWSRWVVKNMLDHNPEAALNYLRDTNPDMEIGIYDDEFVARDKNSGRIMRLDEAGPSVNDITDSTVDLINDAASSTAGGLAYMIPGIGPAAGPVAAGGTSYGLESLRQNLADYFYGEYGTGGMGVGQSQLHKTVTGAAGGIAPLIAGYDMPVLGKTSLFKEGAEKAAGAGLLGAARGKIKDAGYAGMGEMMSGVPKNVLEALPRQRDYIRKFKSEGEYIDDVMTRFDASVDKLKDYHRQIGQDMDEMISVLPDLTDKKVDVSGIVERLRKEAAKESKVIDLVNVPGVEAKLKQVEDEFGREYEASAAEYLLHTFFRNKKKTKTEEPVYMQEIPLQRAIELYRLLDQTSEIHKVKSAATGFKSRLADADMYTKKYITQASKSAHDIRRAAKKEMPKELKDLIDDYAMLANKRDKLSTMLGKDEAAFRNLSGLYSGSLTSLFRKNELEKLDVVAGTEFMDAAEKAAVANTFVVPKFLPKTGQGTTSTSRTGAGALAGATIGSTLGAFAGAAIPGMNFVGAQAGQIGGGLIGGALGTGMFGASSMLRYYDMAKALRMVPGGKESKRRWLRQHLVGALAGATKVHGTREALRGASSFVPLEDLGRDDEGLYDLDRGNSPY